MRSPESVCTSAGPEVGPSRGRDCCSAKRVASRVKEGSPSLSSWAMWVSRVAREVGSGREKGAVGWGGLEPGLGLVAGENVSRKE